MAVMTTFPGEPELAVDVETGEVVVESICTAKALQSACTLTAPVSANPILDMDTKNPDAFFMKRTVV
ncbi:MAG: hypothetical protein KAH44_23730 [Oricola sp.]|nr:hypothetical protein [Oricola sp.]